MVERLPITEKPHLTLAQREALRQEHRRIKAEPHRTTKDAYGEETTWDNSFEDED